MLFVENQTQNPAPRFCTALSDQILDQPGLWWGQVGLIGDARLSSQVPRLPTSQSSSGNLTNDYPTQDGEILHLSWKALGNEWELKSRILVIVLKTKWWDTPLVVSKMMLISAEKVAWVMSELKVDARRSDVGTRLLRRRGQQPTPIISPTDYHFPTDKDWYKTWNRELHWSMKI